MSLRELLHYKLIDFPNYEISVINILLVCVIVLFTWIGLRLIKRLINKRAGILPADGGRRHSMFLIIKYFVWVVVLITCLQLLGVKFTLLLAGSAALLVGLGLGIQQIFNDLVSGLFMLFEGSVQVNDVLEVDGMVCRVKEIKLRSSRVETRDSIVKIIPNHKFINETVTNWSRQASKYARFHIPVGVSYGSDPRHVQRVLTDILNENPETLMQEGYAPFVRLVDFGDSSVNFDMVFWSMRMFRIENVMSDIRFEIFKRFAEEGIEIPFPQRDVHIKSNSGNGGIAGKSQGEQS